MTAISSLERFRQDLARLTEQGDLLFYSMQRDCIGASKFDPEFRKTLGDKAEAKLKALPDFRNDYQGWYSEAKAVVKQLLPDRLADFVRMNEKPKSRKNIDYESYVVADYLQSLRVTFGGDVKVDGSAAIPQFRQSMNILIACERRFTSSLFDIRQLVHADLLDSELAAARELLRHKFGRAAGAVSGVVLESHLKEVLDNHSIKLSKKAPTLGDLSQALKDADVIDTPQWRKIQYLADVRNKCDHKRAADPTDEEVEELISGVEKIVKNLF